MAINTITTILTEKDQISTQLTSACALARALDAHLHVVGLVVGMDQAMVAPTVIDVVPTGAGMAESIALVKELVALASEQLKKEDVRWNMDATTVSGPEMSAEIIKHTRFSDLVVHQTFGNASAGDQTKVLAEAILFDSDCPLLLLPEGADMAAPPSKIMIAWDQSTPALRAARQALALLALGSYVHVVMVDPPRDAPDRSDPGGAFAEFLSRHGIKAQVSVCNKDDVSIASTLQRRAVELGCDLIVMGAYGHSRLRQAIFGGATRDMLEKARLPVLMAH